MNEEDAVFKFQFTPLREGRHDPDMLVYSAPISIHAPPRGATSCRRHPLLRNQYFNSRPSARGDGISEGSKRHRDISIHAPPRGATSQSEHISTTKQISIHAPPRGATGAGATATYQRDVFQFTPLREGRPSHACLMPSQILISIHAPPRGATLPPSSGTPASPYFNSRPSARGDGASSIVKALASYFNSRPSARGDGFPHHVRCAGHISIHAPPRGATRHVSSFIPLHSDFNSRPSARGDGGAFRHDDWFGSISIHAPPRGATAKDMQFLQIFCSTLTNQHGLTIVPRNLSRLFW